MQTPTSTSRRRFVASLAASTAGFAIACTDRTTSLFAPRARSSDLGAGENGFDHVIVVMMENRSFDHLLGWVPRADGQQAGLWFTDRNGIRHRTFTLAPDFQGCGHPDPDHSYAGGRIQFNDGACDGFLRSGNNDEYAIGYYRRPDLDFFGSAIGDWTTGDRYFCSILGPTFPNRFYQHSARTDRISNTAVISTLPTIWDRMADGGLSARYYYSDLPFVALWGAKYLPIARTVDTFFADAAAGTLPNLSFIDPAFGGEGEGTSSDDHPHADIRTGEAFLHRIYAAVTNSPAWERTVLVINYDEWGGFFDHVPPPIAPVSPSDVTSGNVDARLGFRTPLLVVSPFARANYVAHEVFDHTSILKMVQTRWNLAPLSARDAATNNLAQVLDFTQSPRSAPQYPAPPTIIATACPATTTAATRVGATIGEGGGAMMSRSVAGTSIAAQENWPNLRALARTTGWSI